MANESCLILGVFGLPCFILTLWGLFSGLGISISYAKSPERPAVGRFLREKRAAETDCPWKRDELNGTITSPNYPNDYLSSANCSLLIKAPRDSLILVTLDDVHLKEDSNCTYDFLQITERFLQEFSIRYCGRDKEFRSFLSNGRKIQIQFQSDSFLEKRGFKLRYEFVNTSYNTDCPWKSDEFGGTITSPKLSYNYPVDAECSLWIKAPENSRILITLEDVLMPYHCSCDDDFLQITEGLQFYNRSIQYCGRDSELRSFLSHGNEINIHFHVNDTLQIHRFRLRYKFIEASDIDCPWKSDELNGTITSPNYPNDYPSFANCTLWIIAPKYSRILVTLDDVFMADDCECAEDFLQITERHQFSSTVILRSIRYCGDEEEEFRSFLSNTNEIQIQFQSDYSLEERGFKLRYEFINASYNTVCRDPGFIENGLRRNIDGSESPVKEYFAEGQSVVYGCIPNEFCLHGFSILTCKKDGQWSGSLPVCRRVAMCKDPGFIDNGLRRNTNGSESSVNEYFQVGQLVIYGCVSEEFALRGSSFLMCKQDGQWSSPLPVCVRQANSIQLAYCKNPGTVDNARIFYIPFLSQRELPLDPDVILEYYPEGSSLRYYCEEGYILMGPLSLTCENTGNWSPETLPTCENADKVLTCEDPGSVLNGRTLYYAPGQRSGPGMRLHVDNEMKEYPAGSVLEHSCEKGFRLQGSANLTCQSNGFWSADRPRCDGDCGRYFLQSTARIREGHETVVGEYPWVVSISLVEGDCSRFVCGGAVFNTRAVITAAHCLQTDKTYILRFGKHHFRNDKDHPNVLVRISSRVVTHPDYSPRTLDSDIGLVMFEEPIEYSARVQPICLPTIQTTVRNIRKGKVGHISGWGDTERNLPADALLSASLPILSSQECMESYSNQNLTVNITDNMFCAGYANGTYSVCGGDSGSPLVFYDNMHHRYTLEGLVSYVVRRGTDAQMCGLPGRFAIFTKVYRFLPWLYQSIQ